LNFRELSPTFATGWPARFWASGFYFGDLPIATTNVKIRHSTGQQKCEPQTLNRKPNRKGTANGKQRSEAVNAASCLSAICLLLFAFSLLPSDF
jgi:hypothetical protein